MKRAFNLIGLSCVCLTAVVFVLSDLLWLQSHANDWLAYNGGAAGIALILVLAPIIRETIRKIRQKRNQVYIYKPKEVAPEEHEERKEGQA